MKPILELKNLTKYFPVMGGVFRREVGRVYAVNDLCLSPSIRVRRLVSSVNPDAERVPWAAH